MTVPYRTRLEALAARIEVHPKRQLIEFELGAPVSDDEIRDVETSLGVALDPRFLEFFRQCNGVRLGWVQGEPASREELLKRFAKAWDESSQLESDSPYDTCGSLNVPALRDLFLSEPQHTFGFDCADDTYELPILGGIRDDVLRYALRRVDEPALLPQASAWRYNSPIGIVVDARFPDPPCVFGTDHGAQLDGDTPMRARSYLDAMIGIGGSPAARGWLLRRDLHSKRVRDVVIELSEQGFTGADLGEEGHVQRLETAIAEVHRQADPDKPMKPMLCDPGPYVEDAGVYPFSEESSSWTPGAADAELPSKSSPPEPVSERNGPVIVDTELDETLTWAQLAELYPLSDAFSYVSAPWGQPMLRRERDNAVFSFRVKREFSPPTFEPDPSATPPWKSSAAGASSGSGSILLGNETRRHPLRPRSSSRWFVGAAKCA